MSYFTRKAEDIFFKRHPEFLCFTKNKEVSETLELVEIYIENRINKKPKFHKTENHNFHERNSLHSVKR